MTNIYRKYYKVTKGALIEEIKRHIKTERESLDSWEAILEEIGGNSGQFFLNKGQFVGIIFDEEPDRTLFKKVRSGGWMPKRNSKKGKELYQRFKSVKTSNKNDCLLAVGLADAPRLFELNKAHYPSLVIIPWESSPVAYVSVPWYDEDPARIEEYLQERKTGLQHDHKVEAILWEPPEELKPCMEWEVYRAITDYNNSIKGQA